MGMIERIKKIGAMIGAMTGLIALIGICIGQGYTVHRAVSNTDSFAWLARQRTKDMEGIERRRNEDLRELMKSMTAMERRLSMQINDKQAKELAAIHRREMACNVLSVKYDNARR